jgi:hypothetical protein
MATFHGKISKNDLEGGFWELVTDDGERYQLDTHDAELLHEGRRVEIEGKLKQDAMGIGMSSPILGVTRWKNAH